MPEFKNTNKLPERTWVCNLDEFSHLIIISETLFPDEFKSYVMKIVSEQDKMLVTKKKMEIEVSPEFHELFGKSETISSKFSCCFNDLEENERYSRLLKNSRKRKHDEIEEDKILEDLDSLKIVNIKKDQSIQKLKDMISKFETERLKLVEDHEKLVKLYEMRIIDSNGDSIHISLKLRAI